MCSGRESWRVGGEWWECLLGGSQGPCSTGGPEETVGPQACPCLPSEGSVIAYYWSEFSIPQHLEEEAERAMAKKRVITLPPRGRALSNFMVTSVVAFREWAGGMGAWRPACREGSWDTGEDAAGWWSPP